MSLVNRRWAFHDTELSSWVKGAFHALAIDEQRTPFCPTLWHQQPGAAGSGQELKQVWFAGVHCDIGGGYKETALSDIALLWMVHQARKYELEFDAEVEPGKTFALGLGCEIRHASRLVYSDGLDLGNAAAATPIGMGCRICERTDCPQRAVPPLDRQLAVDEYSSTFVPYPVAEQGA